MYTTVVVQLACIADDRRLSRAGGESSRAVGSIGKELLMIEWNVNARLRKHE